MCELKAFPPSPVHLLVAGKLISTVDWAEINGGGGGPELAPKDTCPVCLEELLAEGTVRGVGPGKRVGRVGVGCRLSG